MAKFLINPIRPSLELSVLGSGQGGGLWNQAPAAVGVTTEVLWHQKGRGLKQIFQ